MQNDEKMTVTKQLRLRNTGIASRLAMAAALIALVAGAALTTTHLKAPEICGRAAKR